MAAACAEEVAAATHETQASARDMVRSTERLQEMARTLQALVGQMHGLSAGTRQGEPVSLDRCTGSAAPHAADGTLLAAS